MGLKRTEKEKEKKQEEVYNALVAYTQRKNYVPTRRELGIATNLSGWEVNSALQALQDRGLIKITPRTPRAIVLVGYILVKRV